MDHIITSSGTSKVITMIIRRCRQNLVLVRFGSGIFGCTSTKVQAKIVAKEFHVIFHMVLQWCRSLQEDEMCWGLIAEMGKARTRTSHRILASGTNWASVLQCFTRNRVRLTCNKLRHEETSCCTSRFPRKTQLDRQNTTFPCMSSMTFLGYIISTSFIQSPCHTGNLHPVNHTREVKLEVLSRYSPIMSASSMAARNYYESQQAGHDPSIHETRAETLTGNFFVFIEVLASEIKASLG